MAYHVNAVISRSSILAYAALVLLALHQPAVAQEEATGPLAGYLDDRSSPEALIRSYYNAVNRQEYARAYSYYSEEGREPDFDKYAKGYQNTKSVEIKLGKAQPDGAAGSIYWSLPIAVKSVSTDGKDTVFTGCYTLRLANPANQAVPPFHPMSIMTGSLTPSEKSLEESVPEQCETP
ncbi:hypothetical protein C7477_103175 [Phyllobacterium leguminum]|uniref:Uncharacterized protein n=1 Tax=Phyllobacterium leguminum TaxID=314237 RepID=A0A318TE66_9HYPH|nr:hypothetical protein [Phyllobacterium leguminum]PYE89666.1 hypothetical protein C7477_103175 [Phyllobacterium leguminum]